VVAPGRLHPAVAALAFAAWIAATTFLAVHHEPWRDEADPWLVARDADAATFLRRASLSGTPALWHLILVPLARGGAPYDAQKALHLAIAAASVALLLWRSPFPPLTKLAAVFSYYFAYEYAVVVRSYALSILLLLVLAMWYRERLARPWRTAAVIALLANTNTHSLFIAALLGLFFAYEVFRQRLARTHWKPAALMLAGGLAAAAQLLSASGERATTFVHVQPSAPIGALGQAFLPLFASPAAPLLGLALLACATALLWSRPVLVVLLWSWIAALSLIFVFWWIGGLRHAGLFLVLLLVVLWIDLADAPAARPAARTLCLALLTAALLFADYSAFAIGRADRRFAFSGAEEIADFLRARGLVGRTIAAHSETTTSAVAPYLARPLWYAGIEEYGTFPMWDRKFDAGLDIYYDEALRRVRRRFGADPNVLVLFNVEIPDPAREGVELLYTNRIPIFAHTDERFWLYRLRE
jgi:hypothetical protein